MKWPELLEKFRSTQDKARRRNEILMRGEASGNRDALGGGPATRSLMELDTSVGGRASRNSMHEGASAGNGGAGVGPGGRGLNRPGSGLSRPLATGRTQDSSMGAQGGRLSGASGTGSYGAPGTTGGPLGDAKGHRSKHSLAGTMGKFASNIARGSASRDRKADDAGSLKKDKDKR